MDEANELGVGAMGFGGKVSLIGCKIAAANRLPASFFVSVAYDCWAFRRLGVRLDARDGAITSWLYRDPSRPVERMTQGEGFPLTGREIVLTAPLTEEMVRSLKVGDVVLIQRRVVYGPRCCACVSDEESAARGSERRGALSLRTGDAEAGRTVERESGWSDDQYSRRALPGGCDQTLRRAGRDRQRRDGREDAGGAEGIRRGLPECDRRRGAVLCADGAKTCST